MKDILVLQDHRLAKTLRDWFGVDVTVVPANRFLLDQDFDSIGLLVLSGTGSIRPEVYGGEPVTGQRYDTLGENQCISGCMMAKARGIPVLGVNRGAQLLCVANGGNIEQGAKGHSAIYHGVACLSALDSPESDTPYHTENRLIYAAPSDHTESILPEDTGHRLVGVSPENDPEVVYWPDTQSLAILPQFDWMDHGAPFFLQCMEYIGDLMEGENV